MSEDVEFKKLLDRWLRGNVAAVQLVVSIMRVAHVWDDLIDSDKPVKVADINEAFRIALTLIPANSFYQEHFSHLHPLLSLAILNWQTATQIERAGEPSEYPISFIIRSDYCNLVLKCAELIGGFDWAATIAPELRQFWHNEGLDGYTKALEQERLARGGK